jgi:hypothetical protein
MTNRTTHARLSDVQLLLLSAAINRPDGSLLPPSVALGGALSDRIRKAIAGLIRRGLAEERETSQFDQIWREEDGRRIGLAITDAGCAAMGATGASEGTDGTMAIAPTPGSSAGANNAAAAPLPSAETRATADAKADSKIAAVVALLERPEGATLLELVDATDWLPHTIRAAMTGLRKKGHAIERSSRDNTTFWWIVAEATAPDQHGPNADAGA